MSTSLICRPYRTGDQDGILDLYRDVFHFEMSPELWRWMYQDAPGGPAVIVVAESDGRLVGHYGVQPRDFWFAQLRCNAGLAVGAMLLPEARNVSAFVELVQLACELSRQHGLAWLYAFPNDQSYRVHCSLLGWRALPQITEWDGPLPLTVHGNIGDVHVWRQMPPDLEFESLETEANSRSVSSARSTSWLRWRFFDRPGGEYILHTVADRQRVTAYAVTKCYQRDGVHYGHLLDWRTTPQSANRSADLLASVWKQLAEWKVDRVSTWALGRNELDANLSNAGLRLTGRKSNFCCLDLDGCHAQIARDMDWRVEMADSDIY